MSLVDSKVVLFNDGEDLDFGDLNDLVKGATQRAWEWPGYADALAHAPVVGSGTPSDYDTLFTTGTDIGKIVYSRGYGVHMHPSTLDFIIGTGFMGIYEAAAPPAVVSPQMQWIYNGAALTFTRPAAPGGQKRYDVLTLAIAETAGDSASRDFQDATTGNFSTTTPNKRTRLTGTITVTSGTASASPTPPVVSGHVIAMVLVNSTAIEAWFDCTQPWGPSYTTTSVPQIHSYLTGNLASGWAPVNGGSILAQLNAVETVIFPPMFSGDPSAKLIGIEISYAVTAGATMSIVRAIPGTSNTQLVDLTPFITTTGSLQLTSIDMRGYPNFTSGTRGPVWGNGFNSKQNAGFSPGCALGLHVACGSGANDSILYVRWHFAKG